MGMVDSSQRRAAFGSLSVVVEGEANVIPSVRTPPKDQALQMITVPKPFPCDRHLPEQFELTIRAGRFRQAPTASTY
jgi:hypothetical protein